MRWLISAIASCLGWWKWNSPAVLIYAGGDDVLCLAPADEALDLAARLQQLFSAAWIIDTDYQADPWLWRRQNWSGRHDPDLARQRFAIPKMPVAEDGELAAIRLPVTDPDLLERHAAATEIDGPPQIPVQGALLPMLGPFASLSAGIVFAHYKTPMGVLLREVRSLLDDWAKEPFKDDDPVDVKEGEWQGRRAIALRHFSRGGAKTRFALPWSDPGTPPEAHRTVKQVRDAFNAGGELSSRLPYKLREVAPSAYYALQSLRNRKLTDEQLRQAKDSLLEGLFKTCLENSKSKAARAALKLWRAGIDLYPKDPDRYTDGLLLCRALARSGSDSDTEGETE